MAGKSESTSGIGSILSIILYILPVTLAALLLKSVLPYITWLFYSAAVAKLTNAKFAQVLKNDSKTYLSAILLLLLPLAESVSAPPGFERFAYLPTAIVLVVTLSIFVASKAYFLPPPQKTGTASERKGIFGVIDFRNFNSKGENVVVAAAATYTILLSLLSIAKHYALNTKGIDLGIFEQTLWGLAHGKVLFSTVVGDYLFAYHSFFLFYPLAAIYRIIPRIELLFIIQSTVLALGALPLYRLARNKLGKPLGVAVVVLYLLYPALNYISIEDFHIETFAVTTVLFALYFLEQKKDLLFLAIVALTALIKEDAALTAAAIGVYAIIAKRKFKVGVIAVVVAATIFLIATKLFIPHFAQTGNFQTTGFGDLGSTPGQIIRNLVTHPISAVAEMLTTQKLAYLIMLVLPVGGLSLLAPEYLIGAIPAITLALISSAPGRSSIFFHYNANIIPFIFLALITGLARARKFAERIQKFNPHQAKAAITTFIISAALLSAYFYGPLPGAKTFPAESYNFASEHAKAGLELIAMIPPEATVSAANTAVPHLSHREHVYVFPNPFHNAWYLTDMERTVTIDYVLIDLFDQQKEGIMTKEQFTEYFNEILSSPEYGIVDYRDGWVLLRKGAGAEKLCDMVRSYESTVTFLNEITRRCQAAR